MQALPLLVQAVAPARKVKMISMVTVCWSATICIGMLTSTVSKVNLLGGVRSTLATAKLVCGHASGDRLLVLN